MAEFVTTAIVLLTVGLILGFVAIIVATGAMMALTIIAAPIMWIIGLFMPD